ncbi:GntR family transcriptional regulator [Paenibacillus massiliensis]|uniref:GntR family transcriptional regulator n=1 Tax=Paenibacillus massiliensis TaxID=225917 RepID=UPI00048F976D|nr:GntR family transcriptional regulator [Paenibacillus massiliensis]
MARRNGSSTLSENVLQQLRSQILSGSLPPGKPLKASELSGVFEVSIAVIREALTRLAEQGLIVSLPNLGFSVKTISTTELQNLIEFRILNEGAALASAIEHGDIHWESTIIGAYHKLSQTPQYSSENPTQINEQWTALHREFHQTILSACPNRFLTDLSARLWDLSELYRHWSITRDLNRNVDEEHKTLMNAIISRNSSEALELHKQHIHVTADILIKEQN